MKAAQHLKAIAKRSLAKTTVSQRGFSPMKASKQVWSSLGIAGAIALGTVSPAAAQVAVTNLTTTNQAATSSSYTTTVANPCGSYTCGTSINMQFGLGSDRLISGFVSNTQTYTLQRLVDRIALRRVNNTLVTGNRDVAFFESGTNTNQVNSSAATSMESVLLNQTINRGADNVFANTYTSGAGNINNIERVDFIVPGGLSVPSSSLGSVGFLILERGGNDPFKIAAITSVDASGNPTGFGPLVNVPTTSWGNTGINIATTVMRKEQSDANFKPSDRVASQNIGSIYFSFSSLGIAANQTIYGYALFPNDITVTASNDLVNYNAFPTNTSDASGSGGLDLMAGGGIFAANNLVSISGNLYQDSNLNNTLDTSEQRLPANVTVKLLDSAGTTTLATTTTDANGQYTFAGVTSGTNYKIQVDTTDSDIPAGFILDTQRNNLTVNVSTTNVSNINFGFVPAPALTVTKTTSTANVKAGSPATYTITVTNAAGKGTASNVTISDTLPSGFTYASTTTPTLSGGATRPSTTNPAAGATAPTWGNFTIPGGGSVSITFIANVNTNVAAATYQNTATANYTTPAGTSSSASYDSAVSTGEDVTVQPIVSGYKSVKLTTDADNTTTVTPGDTVTWTLSYANTGTTNITTFQIADSLPTGITIAGTPTVSANATQGTAPTVNTAYNGTNNTNLLSAATTLKVGGVITVNIPVKINSGVTGTLSNQATGSGTNLPTAGVKTDNVDSSTTNLPTGVTVPSGSIDQTEASSIDPTTVSVVAASRFCRGTDIPLISFQNPTLVSGTALQAGAVYRFPNVTSGVDALVSVDKLNNGATLNNIDGQGSTGGVGSVDAFQPELNANVNVTDSSIDFTITFVKAGTSTPVTLSGLHASGVDIDGNGDTAKPLREYVELSDFSRYTVDKPTNLNTTITSLAPLRGRFESKDTTNQPGITLNATQNIATGEYTNVSTFKYRIGAFNVVGATAPARLASLYFDCVSYASPVTTTPTPPTIDLDGDNSSAATGNNYQKTFIVGKGAVSAADTDVKITDEKNFINSATITLTNRPDGNSESLSIDATAGGTVSGVTASAYDPATGKITLTSTTPGAITLAQYQAIIATLKYNNTAASPNTTNRTINVQVTDSDGLVSNTAVSTISIVMRANLLLVKRITAINSTPITTVVDDPNDANDTHANWPSSYLKGATTQNGIKPGDVVEYTIYFLSTGGSDASNATLCDLVPANTTFFPDAFASGKGIKSSLGTTTTDLTNTNDTDKGRFYASTETAPTGCRVGQTVTYGNGTTTLTNAKGAVVVDLGTVTKATAPGTVNSYGFIKFQVKVN